MIFIDMMMMKMFMNDRSKDVDDDNDDGYFV